MRTILLLLAVATLAPAASQADAGVSPFIAMLDPDDLPSSYHDAYDFSRVDAVYVMSEADADRVTWRRYVDDSAGERLIGAVAYDVAAAEVLAVADGSVVSTTMVAIADDRLLDDLVDRAHVGPCGRETALVGTVAADLMSSRVTGALSGLSRSELAVGVAPSGLHTTPITALGARTTGTRAVTIINPDSMMPGGWCGANPTPHP